MIVMGMDGRDSISFTAPCIVGAIVLRIAGVWRFPIALGMAPAHLGCRRSYAHATSEREWHL